MLGAHDRHDAGDGIGECATRCRIREFRALAYHELRDLLFYVRRGRERLRRRIEIRECGVACTVVCTQYDIDDLGLRLQEVLAHVERTKRIERDIAVDQLRAGLELGGRHVRMESGPSIDLTSSERDAPIGM